MRKNRPKDSLNSYMKQLSRYPTLSREEEQEIIARWKEGDRRAAEELVCGSLWHVVYVARRYVSSGEPLEDLIAEGNLALLHALRKYDPSFGTRFGTYARLWIRAYLTRYVRRGRSLVSSPLHEPATMLSKIRRERRKLAAAVPTDRVDALVAKRLGISVEQIAQLDHRFSQRDISFDVPIDNDQQNLHEMLPAPDPGPHDIASVHQLEDLLEGAIDRAEMPDVERFIIKRRLLSQPGEEPSLAQLARELSVSREWARRLEKRGLKRLETALEDVRQIAAETMNATPTML
jgi:RNA polymerase sigma factor (sigma-70 family)